KGDTVERWIAKMEAATRTLPVIVSEFGGRNAKDEPWVRQVLQALEDHQWDWTAWDMHPAASPCLIRDWKYTPTPFFGQRVKLAREDRLPRYTPPPASATRKTASAPAGGDIGPLAILRTAVVPAIIPGVPAAIDDEPEGLFESHRDVGEVRHPGSIVFDKDARTYTVAGSGANMWARRDAFHSAWERV